MSEIDTKSTSVSTTQENTTEKSVDSSTTDTSTTDTKSSETTVSQPATPLAVVSKTTELETEITETTVTKKYISYVPTKNVKLLSLGEMVSTMLLTDDLGNTNLQQAPFVVLLTEFRKSILELQEIKASIELNTKAIKEIDVRCLTRLRTIKSYLDETFGDQKIDYYTTFGIIPDNNSGYIFPTNRNERLLSIERLIPALTKYNYTDRLYGPAYWQKILDDYNLFMKEAISLTGKKSTATAKKNELKTQVRAFLTSVKKAIEIKYPLTSKTVLREWGYQRETY